jgi:hypothetical protein
MVYIYKAVLIEGKEIINLHLTGSHRE